MMGTVLFEIYRYTNLMQEFNKSIVAGLGKDLNVNRDYKGYSILLLISIMRQGRGS